MLGRLGATDKPLYLIIFLTFLSPNISLTLSLSSFGLPINNFHVIDHYWTLSMTVLVRSRFYDQQYGLPSTQAVFCYHFHSTKDLASGREHIAESGPALHWLKPSTNGIQRIRWNCSLWEYCPLIIWEVRLDFFTWYKTSIRTTEVCSASTFNSSLKESPDSMNRETDSLGTISLLMFCHTQLTVNYTPDVSSHISTHHYRW